jgi:hypothetical protein
MGYRSGSVKVPYDLRWNERGMWRGRRALSFRQQSLRSLDREDGSANSNGLNRRLIEKLILPPRHFTHSCTGTTGTGEFNAAHWVGSSTGVYPAGVIFDDAANCIQHTCTHISIVQDIFDDLTAMSANTMPHLT